MGSNSKNRPQTVLPRSTQWWRACTRVVVLLPLGPASHPELCADPILTEHPTVIDDPNPICSCSARRWTASVHLQLYRLNLYSSRGFPALSVRDPIRGARSLFTLDSVRRLSRFSWLLGTSSASPVRVSSRPSSEEQFIDLSTWYRRHLMASRFSLGTLSLRHAPWL